ncbi:MAG TPA: hypothetical protein EYP90_08125 [Chromatiaceae bacterium]|nr:hypothetical protein [Chromatiaceae bacterium]
MYNEKMYNERKRILADLQLDTGVRCLFLFSQEGYLIDEAGDTSNLDTEAIGALIAAEFAAAASLATLIGNKLTFTSNYHEGPDYSMYVHGVRDKGLLVAIYDTNSNLGTVRYYTNKTINDLEQLVSTGILPPLDQFSDKTDLEHAMNSRIEQLFGLVEQ